jgi:TM2 domain-containing membrane protein YozV
LENHPGRKGRLSGRGRRVVAVVLSLIQPGAGHFLLGRFRRGIAWLVGLAGVVLVLLFAMPLNFVTIVAAIVILPVTRVACAVDTLRVAFDRPRWAIGLSALGVLVVLNLLTDPLKEYYRDPHGGPEVAATRRPAMTHDHGQGRGPDRWAHLRFAVVGPLLAAPPAPGGLKAALTALARQPWLHPISGRRPASRFRPSSAGSTRPSANAPIPSAWLVGA